MLDSLRRFEIPGVLHFRLGPGGLPRAEVMTPSSQAEIYLHGAQVTGFQKKGEAPLLFLSQASRFEAGKAIRGGIPICFPWFGSRPGQASHGYARITDWTVIGATVLPDGDVVVRFAMPEIEEMAEWSSCRAELTVTVSERLDLEFFVTNLSSDRPLEFDECLHTYLAVGDAGQISIHGLESAHYLDKLAGDAERIEGTAAIRIACQTDRTYLDTTGAVEVRDPVLKRTIRVGKSGSASTVVWNPWTTQPLADLATNEYRQFVCVESGNVERNRIILAPGKAAVLRVKLATIPW